MDTAPPASADAEAQSPGGRAIVLVAHGSPDPDWARPIVAVLDRVRARLDAERPGVVVRLHLLSQGLPHLEGVVADLARIGCADVRVVACFLSAGGRHFKRDLPDHVAHVQQQLPQVRLTLAPAPLGEDDEVIAALASAAVRLGAG